MTLELAAGTLGGLLSSGVPVACREDGSGLQPLDDTLVYSTIEDEWQKPDISGSVPRARNAAVACLLEQNKMLLHGGWEPFRNTYSDSLILHS